MSASGIIRQVVTLPDSVNARQRGFGFEGVATVGSGFNESVFVAFQREWLGDPDGLVRIGRNATGTGVWMFFYYPIETPTSPNGGWVGLSDLTLVDADTFAVIERDNQAGADARIKRLYAFSVANLEPQPDPGQGIVPTFPVVEKQRIANLLPDLRATGGSVLEKLEGLAVLPDGTALVVNDNDGVDGSNGETQLLRLEGAFSGRE